MIHYGVSSPMKSKEIKNKVKDTMMKRYGVPYYFLSNRNGYTISKINKNFSNLLNNSNIENELEFVIDRKSYDLHILNSNILIEINPTYTHNSTLSCWFNNYNKPPLVNTYHIEKTKLVDASETNSMDLDIDNQEDNVNIEMSDNVELMEDGTIRFTDNGKAVFDDTVFRLLRGSRTAVLGPNGAGKTTLFRLIREGDLIRSVPKARLGFFHQDLSGLREDDTVLENVMRDSVQKEGVVRSVLAQLLFSARDIRKPVRVLSGGEKIRLCFARLFTSPANVLILDEPTNYLDIPSVEALERLFREYEGTMLFASHDKTFVDAVATDRLVIRDRKIVPV